MSTRRKKHGRNRRAAPAKSGPWLAGVKTPVTVHYVCVGSAARRPGWTPYAALARRWHNRATAEVASKSALAKFGLKNGKACVQTEKEAFAE